MTGSSGKRNAITSKFYACDHTHTALTGPKANGLRFHAFFHHVDHFRTDFFLWVTASGLSAAKQSKAPARTDNNSDDEADVNGEEG